MPGHGPANDGGSNGTRSASLADFKQVSLLGEGAYSAVYKVLRLADRETYALKKVKLPALSEKEKQNALNEVRLLASVRNDHVIAYKEAFFDERTRCLCIVQEFAADGDLFQQVARCQKERTHIREADVWRYLFGMCRGLKALHDIRILHRDLKCANVFLGAVDPDSPGSPITAKLGDFNVSKVAKRGLCMTQTGTPYYASPEVWRDMPYDAKSDLWSLGCVLYECAALRPPFRAEDMEGLYRKVLRGQYPRIPTHYGQDLAEVIALLLQVNPRHRPSVDQVLQLPAVCRHAQCDATSDERGSTNLMDTIKLPKNALELSTILPNPRYERSSYGARARSLPPSLDDGEAMSERRETANPRNAPASARRVTPLDADDRDRDALLLLPQGRDTLDAYLREGREASTPLQNRTFSGEGPIDSLDAYLAQAGSTARRAYSPGASLRGVAPLVRPMAAEGRERRRPGENPRQPSREPSVQPSERRLSVEPRYGDVLSVGAVPLMEAGRGNGSETPPPPHTGASHRAPPPPSGGTERPVPAAAPSYSTPQGHRGAANATEAPRRDARRPMASYARAQYSAAAAPPGPPPQATKSPGSATGLRLPRIFGKAN